VTSRTRRWSVSPGSVDTLARGDHYEVEDVLKMLVKSGGGRYVRCCGRPDFRITHVRLEPRNSKRWVVRMIATCCRWRHAANYGVHTAALSLGKAIAHALIMFSITVDDDARGHWNDLRERGECGCATPQKSRSRRCEAKRGLTPTAHAAGGGFARGPSRCAVWTDRFLSRQRVVANKWKS